MTFKKPISRIRPVCLAMLLGLVSLAGCYREPYLHLPGEYRDFDIPLVDLNLVAYWNYKVTYSVEYDWKAEWYYGYSFEDSLLLGKIGYTKPKGYNVRRYFTYQQQYGPHTNVLSNSVKDSVLHCEFEFGFWDILVWNQIEPFPGDLAQNLNINESLEKVTAYTNQSTRSTRYRAPNYSRAFWQPEELFAAYSQGEEIDEQLTGFDYDSIRNVWIKKLNMKLEPLTYIYLTQVLIHNNNNKIIGVDGSADLSGVARETNLNTGVSDVDSVSVTYNVFFKPRVVIPQTNKAYYDNETHFAKDSVIAVVGGRVLTFGIPNQNGNRVGGDSLPPVVNPCRQYIDVKMLFNNGMDSTFVFDVTDQITSRWKGGVITCEIDMDTIRIPRRSGGSAFNAVVKDYEDGGTYEFPM